MIICEFYSKETNCNYPVWRGHIPSSDRFFDVEKSDRIFLVKKLFDFYLWQPRIPRPIRRKEAKACKNIFNFRSLTHACLKAEAEAEARRKAEEEARKIEKARLERKAEEQKKEEEERNKWIQEQKYKAEKEFAKTEKIYQPSGMNQELF